MYLLKWLGLLPNYGDLKYLCDAANNNLINPLFKFFHKTLPKTGLYLALLYGLTQAGQFSYYYISSESSRQIDIETKILAEKKTSEFENLRFMIFQFIPRNDFIIDLDCQDIILLEGYGGSGKTTFSQSLIIEQSKIRPTLYMTFRGLENNIWQEQIGEQIGFVPQNLFMKNWNYGLSLNIMIKSLENCRDLNKWSHYFLPYRLLFRLLERNKNQKKLTPLLVIDDIQAILNLDQRFIQEIFDALILLYEKNIQIVLVSSDNSVKNQFENISGIGSRIKHIKFPSLPQQVLENKINDIDQGNLFQTINDYRVQQGKQPFQNRETLLQFVIYCGTDMRSFVKFIKRFNGDIEQTFDIICEEIKQKLGELDDQPRKQQFIKLVYENINGIKLKDIHNLLDDQRPTSDELNQLIKKNLIRKSYDQNQDPFYEFYSKTVRFAYIRKYNMQN